MIARPKHQRLVLVVLALLAVLGAVLLAMWGLKDRAAYFYTPADVVAGKAVAGKAVRLGGMVERGSVKRDRDGVTTRFMVEDGEARVLVSYRGILPDLFREGSGVVAEGKLAPDQTFVADNILAKHDERYMPPELGNQAAEHKVGRTLKR
ncbi:cytochrome c maturation protein CcmE [Sphingomonas sediminicola]|uniref:Cytochrome c-type biogenesis protein CcmE n=1 Tax=Sphingomonas sediminicola TaxID=386874 RepID=A0ABX6TAE4_9SPHN|nr:cytochrome c maturation protein CcmE [Sphingomonas sediminicola]QNP46640.1 cytochrome c maturation protein CcmE [Sphingomonas sediminicola]